LGKRTVEFLFETNRATRYAPRRIQHISKETAEQAQITRQIYPHLLQHSVGTITVPEAYPLPTLSFERKQPQKMVKPQQTVYALSELGKAAYRENVSESFFDGKHHGFCYGEPRIVEIINYSEPADILEQKVSEVHFRYALYNLAPWVASDKIKYASEQSLNGNTDPSRLKKSMNANKLEQITNAITRDIQSVKDSLRGKAVLILTNSGWMHENMFRKQ
jgi:hypothetical protein